MEIYRNSSQFIYLDIHNGSADDTPTAEVIIRDADPVPLTVIEINDGIDPNDQRWEAVLGFAQTQDVGELKVVWEFEVASQPAIKTDFYDVVVPLAEIDDVRTELGLGDEFTDGQIIKAERQVRRMIESFTGQQFAPVEQTVFVNSSSDTYLNLPKRIISIDSIETSRYPVTAESLQISHNGWYVIKHEPYFPSTVYVSRPMINDPYSEINRSWRNGEVIGITGTFGWERVPAPINEAALILIEERLCPETLYRDRYIKTMTAADFRFELDKGAYAGTGNVVADQILLQWRVNNVAVI